MNKHVKFIIFLFSFSILNSQVVTDTVKSIQGDSLLQEENIENKIEQFTEKAEQEVDFSELTQNLEYYSRHPLNLNTATYEDLVKLGLLNDIQIRNLLTHRQKYGKLISIYELQAIDGFDLQTIYRILPYVKIASEESKTSWSLRNVKKYSKSFVLTRFTHTFPLAEGYKKDSGGYLGSPYKLYVRYNFSYFNLLSFGFTAEKDQGEEFFKGSQKQGFDFYSYHFYMRNVGPFLAVALGDYTLEFGQGLAMWTGLSFGKTSDAIYIKKSGRGILPYRSANEFNFLRGAAVQLKLTKYFYLYGFTSMRAKDGSGITTDSINQEEYTISSLNESGLHNTTTSVERKNNVKENLIGSRIQLNLNRLQVGYTSYLLHFNVPVVPSSDLYQQFYFSGKQQWINSIDYSFLYRNMNFFGEVAYDGDGLPAQIHGLMYAANYHYSLALLYRDFPRDFTSFFGSPLSEGSKPINERALYMGHEIKFSKQWWLSSYIDLFHFPWLRYQVDAPSDGVEFLSQLNYAPNKRSQFYFRYKYESKKNNFSETYAKIPLDNRKQTFRIHAAYPISDAFVFKTRVEILLHKYATESTKMGFLAYQDVVFRKKNSPLNFTLRLATFDTYSYDERIYAYENDVLYSYSIPAYYYKGSRTYFLVKYRARKNLEYWFRIAHTLYVDRTTMGSGLDLINNPAKTEVKFQIRYTF